MCKKPIIATAIMLGMAAGNSDAALVADGIYNLVVNTTPTYTTSYGSTAFRVGKAGNWKSSFTFNNTPNSMSNGMTDNDVQLAPPGSGALRGSSVSGDGYAGVLELSFVKGNISVNSFQFDTIFGTAGGNFAQYTDPNSTGSAQGNTDAMFGTIDNAGNMSLTMDGRLGAIDGLSNFFDKRWNYDDSAFNAGAPFWSPMTTGTITDTRGAFTITGSAVSNIGDINGDLIDDYSVILVSAGAIGKDWSGFSGIPYTEVWNAQIISTGAFTSNNDSVFTIVNNPVITVNVLANDSLLGNASAFAVTVFDSTSERGGSVTNNGDNTFTYIPPVGFMGLDSFTYTVSDGVSSSVATVEIVVLSEAAGVLFLQSENPGTANTASVASSGGSSGGATGLLALSVMLLLLPLRFFARKK